QFVPRRLRPGRRSRILSTASTQELMRSTTIMWRASGAIRTILLCFTVLLTLGSQARAATHGRDTDEKDLPFPPATPKSVVDVTGRIFPAVVRLDVAQEIYSEGKRTV